MAIDIGRRQFISALGGAAAWPFAARAQQRPMPAMGFLSSRSAIDSAPQVATFRAALSEAGYVDQQNVAIDYRRMDGQYDWLPALAVDPVRRHVAVIFCDGPPAVLAAKAETTSIPIISVSADDPVKSGLVASLNRPGAEITIFTAQLAAKQFGLLRRLVPGVAMVAMLVNPNNPATETATTDVQAAAARTGHRIRG